jgi:hypothetical protein
VPYEANLWARPECERRIDQLLRAPGAPAKSSINRTFAVLDALVTHHRDSRGALETIDELRPQPLARARVVGVCGSLEWPDTAEGREFARSCQSLELCLFQVGHLRSVVAIVICPRETFVVWLSAEYTDEPNDDGILDETALQLAQGELWGKMNDVLDLGWLESQ